jgi:hypothetical protein
MLSQFGVTKTKLEFTPSKHSECYMHSMFIYLKFVSSSIVCGRLPAEIVGSNPTGGMDICLL